MKVGDLVKYRHYHNNLQDLMGIVLRVDRAKERVKVLWNRPECNDEVLDWVDDLDVIKKA
jgi:hypothetical protein